MAECVTGKFPFFKTKSYLTMKTNKAGTWTWSQSHTGPLTYAKDTGSYSLHRQSEWNAVCKHKTMTQPRLDRHGDCQQRQIRKPWCQARQELEKAWQQKLGSKDRWVSTRCEDHEGNGSQQTPPVDHEENGHLSYVKKQRKQWLLASSFMRWKA